MILHELVRYYDRLQDSDIGLPSMGFSNEKIGFALVIDKDGQLIQLDDLRDRSGKKPQPRLMRVPSVKRTSGIKPAFAWDKLEYVLGVVPKDKKTIKNEDEPVWEVNEKSSAKFEAFRKYHQEISTILKHDGLRALVVFLENWQPNSFSDLADAQSAVGANIVVQVLGSNTYLHESKNLKDYWSTQVADNDSDCIRCLVTGEEAPLAQLHAGIKGVPGSQTSGAPIVSFNKDSFCSYGKGKNDQGGNAPVGQHAAFAYGTVLNYLLSRNSKQKVQVADATVLFWAEKSSSIEDIFGGLLAPSKDDGYSKEIDVFLKTVRKGGMPEDIDGSQRFYILGLSPNAARLSIRFWYVSTVSDVSRKLALHFEQLEIIRKSEKQLLYPGIWWLLIETASQHKTENIPPSLSGPMLMSILKGTAYSASLLSLLLGRMRVDKDPNYYKCALIKAILIRNYKKEVSVSLDREKKDAAYVLGRLFAVLEKAQEESAGGKLNASIKDKYFASASTHPSVTFPLLIRLSQNHQKKLKSERAGRAIFFQKEIQSIIASIDTFPSYLNLEDQGLFAIGYYHQYQSFFEKHEKEETSMNNDEDKGEE